MPQSGMHTSHCHCFENERTRGIKYAERTKSGKRERIRDQKYNAGKLLGKTVFISLQFTEITLSFAICVLYIYINVVQKKISIKK